jgi:NADH:ubiquinone oxidoreductase subunit D
MTEADSSSKAHVVQDATEVAELARSGRLQTEEMVLNVGPQHPATHGVFRLLLTIDGELITNAEPIIGYMHRGYEKLARRVTTDRSQT